MSFPPQRSAEQAPLNVSQKGSLTFPLKELSERERERDVFKSHRCLPFFSHLGHNVGYRLPYVYAKYGKAESACL